MKLPKDWKEIKLTQILDESDFKKVEEFAEKDDWKGLRKYLNSIKDKLEKKGVYPDYLYYVLEYQLKK